MNRMKLEQHKIENVLWSLHCLLLLLLRTSIQLFRANGHTRGMSTDRGGNVAKERGQRTE
jgi:hypothetical protein